MGTAHARLNKWTTSADSQAGVVSVVYILRRALNTIRKPYWWQPGFDARARNGRVCLPWERDAAIFSVAGAIARVVRAPVSTSDVANEALNAVRRALPSGFYIVSDYELHPNTTHDDIVALFKRAIAAEGGVEE